MMNILGLSLVDIIKLGGMFSCIGIMILILRSPVDFGKALVILAKKVYNGVGEWNRNFDAPKNQNTVIQLTDSQFRILLEEIKNAK